MKKLDSHAAMDEWDKTWRMHHLPLWAKKAIRLDAIKRGVWRGHELSESYLPQDLFDHWGSVRRGGGRALVAQPYGDHDTLANQFSNQFGWNVYAYKPGPWHEGTWCYEFLPRL